MFLVDLVLKFDPDLDAQDIVILIKDISFNIRVNLRSGRNNNFLVGIFEISNLVWILGKVYRLDIVESYF